MREKRTRNKRGMLLRNMKKITPYIKWSNLVFGVHYICTPKLWKYKWGISNNHNMWLHVGSTHVWDPTTWSEEEEKWVWGNTYQVEHYYLPQFGGKICRLSYTL